MKNVSTQFAWLASSLAIIIGLPVSASTVTLAIDETVAGSIITMSPDPNQPFVGGIVLVCESGVDVPNGGLTNSTGGLKSPFTVFNACAPGPNFGISDIVAFIPTTGGPFGNPPTLTGYMVSDLDDGADAALGPVPGIFVNPTIVAIFEGLDSTGTIEYEPGQNEPGYFVDASGNNPVYQIKSDCSFVPLQPPCSTPGPQTPILSTEPGTDGSYRVGNGTISEVPEPKIDELLGCSVALLTLANYIRNRPA